MKLWNRKSETEVTTGNPRFVAALGVVRHQPLSQALTSDTNQS